MLLLFGVCNLCVYIWCLISVILSVFVCFWFVCFLLWFYCFGLLFAGTCFVGGCYCVGVFVCVCYFFCALLFDLNLWFALFNILFVAGFGLCLVSCGLCAFICGKAYCSGLVFLCYWFVLGWMWFHFLWFLVFVCFCVLLFWVCRFLLFANYVFCGLLCCFVFRSWGLVWLFSDFGFRNFVMF